METANVMKNSRDNDIMKEIHESIEQEKRGEVYPWEDVREMLIDEILQGRNNP